MKWFPTSLTVLSLWAFADASFGMGHWYVDPTVAGPGSGTFQDPYSSLQYALLQPTTVSGDTIEVWPGTLFENVVHPADKDHLRITSWAPVVLDGMGVSSCYRLATTGVTRVTFDGSFRFQNGVGASSAQGSVGGGLSVEGADLDLDGEDGFIEVVDCTADLGGGIYVKDADLTLNGGAVRRNTALGGPGQGGGIHFASATGNHLSLGDAVLIDDNEAQVGGGIYLENASFDMIFTNVRANHARSIGQPALGGGIAAFGSTLVQKADSWVAQNTSDTYGGGLYLESSTLSVEGALGGITGNRAGDTACSQAARGGGIHASCDSTVSGTGQTLLTDNSACIEGGGVYGGSSISGLRILRNVARHGAGVHGGSCDPTVSQCELRENEAHVWGGAALGGGAYGVHLVGCTLAENRANGGGAGAHTSTLEGCLVEGNLLLTLDDEPPAAGGGIADSTAIACTLRANEAELGGGAANSVLEDCTLELNRARSWREQDIDPLGGGAYACTLDACTLRANRLEVSEQWSSHVWGGGAVESTLTGCVVEANVVEDTLGSSTNFVAGGGLADCEAVDCVVRDNVVLAAQGVCGGAFRGSLEGCVVTGNESAIFPVAHQTSFERCTVVDHPGGAGLVVARNSIFVGNGSGGQVSGTVTYCLVQGGHQGVGNIDADPLFVDRVGGDYHLQPASPCIDAGDPTTFDPDGTVADMGAFAFDFLSHSIGTTTCTSNPNSTGHSAVLRAYGSDDVSDNLVLFRIDNLPPGKPGYMLMAAGPDFVPLFGGGQGNLCLASPLVRFNKDVLHAGAGGTAMFRPDLTQLPSGTVVLPGDDWYFQFWHRDHNPQLTHNTSSAVRILFQ